MAIDFPVSPTVGQQYTYQGATYIFSAQGVWVQISNSTTVNSLSVNFLTITANGNYVPSPGMQSCIAEAIAGGGGGGGSVGTAGQLLGGGGGGSGGYSRKRLTAADVGVSLPVTIGPGGVGGAGANAGTAGGTTSIGSVCIALGGDGGAYINTALTQTGIGGAGGAPGTGDFVAAGAPGGSGVASGSGEGGSSPYGGGGRSVFTTGAVSPGNPGRNYGSGASGAHSASIAANGTGGTGSPGVVFITEFIAASGSGGGGGGVSTSFSDPQGRLTLQTAVPVMTTSQLAKTTIFYAPYVGNQIPLYNGTGYVMTEFAELSVLTTDTTKNPAAIGVNRVNDWFVWSDAGTLRLSHGVDWSNDVTPVGTGARPGLVRVKGIWLNEAAIANGPVAQRGTYVGTTRSNASSQLNWQLPGIQAGGFQGILGVWNAYNRVLAGGVTIDSTASWIVNVTTPHVKNSNNGNSIMFISGLEEDRAQAINCAGLVINASDGITLMAGIGVDSSSVFVGSAGQGSAGVSVNAGTPTAYHSGTSFGWHIWYALQATNGGSNVTCFGGLGGPPARNASSFSLSFPM